jgi:hypothetical protein
VKAIAGEPAFFVDVPRMMRDRDLKDRFCEIDGDGRMLHVDSSLPWPSERPNTVGTMMPHGRRSPFHRLQLTNADAVGSEVRPLALFICDET